MSIAGVGSTAMARFLSHLPAATACLPGRAAGLALPGIPTGLPMVLPTGLPTENTRGGARAVSLLKIACGL